MLLLLGSVVARAEPAPNDPDGRVVADVIPMLSGNQRTQKAQITSLIKTKPGAKYSRTVVDDDLKNLIKNNSFDINSTVEPIILADGKVNVVFHLLELPGTTKEIVYKGNKHVKYKDLDNVVNMRKGGAMSPPQNRLAVQEIIRHDHDKGRLMAQCYV